MTTLLWTSTERSPLAGHSLSHSQGKHYPCTNGSERERKTDGEELALHAAGEWELFKLGDASSAYFTSQYMSWGNDLPQGAERLRCRSWAHFRSLQKDWPNDVSRFPVPSCSYWIQVVPISGLTRLTKAGPDGCLKDSNLNWSDLIRLLSNVTRCHKSRNESPLSILCPASAWAAEDGLMEHGPSRIVTDSFAHLWFISRQRLGAPSSRPHKTIQNS